MTHLRSLTSLGLAGLALCALGVQTDAQVFVRNSTDIPNQSNGVTNRFTENVDFGDVDLDGDFDAVFAHGGDQGNIQDRIWINNGGVQAGTLGVFVDQTSTRFPAIARDGRDIEFVDFDNDADLDIYISNTSTNSNQTNQWFTNLGGKQLGSIGFYSEETASRWVNLALGDSSIAASQLIGGGFIDWSCDCDFGDLDNDGDMDLFHSTYGGNFGGNVPSRIFLNDGDGHFEEFNPSGFQLTGSNIANGNPGLWCEGNQSANTTNTTGANCDIATRALDIDLGDIDGDFDLDILHGDRNQNPRFFYNRLEENGGDPSDLAFRDMSNWVFGLQGASWANNSGNYEQEMGDFDGDNDLDLYGLNWGSPAFNDIVAPNVGGRFGTHTILSSSSSDDNEGDFGDYNNDGDLDLFVANFSSTDRLYSNNGSGTFSFVSNATSGLNLHGIGSNRSLDADWCDVDEDGDYDVFAAEDGQRPVIFWENMTGVPDTTAPRVSPVEALSNATAGINGDPDRPVRTHVYDNAPYYITWYNPTRLLLSLEGVQVDSFLAQSVGGQVFRATIGTNVTGNVSYRFRSVDQYGNSGLSTTQNYTASPGARTPENVYGTAFIGTLGLEYELHSRALLTAGKRWYVVMDTKGAPRIHLISYSLASSAPTADPLVGILNIDSSQIFLQQIGLSTGAGFKVRKHDIPDDITGVFSIYLQGFVLEPGGSPTAWSATKGIEVPFYE